MTSLRCITSQVHTHSRDATTPPVTTLHLIGGGPAVEVLSSNEDLIEKLAGYDLPAPEFMTVPAADGTELNAYLLKPRDFDPSREYPLLIHTYGGPGSQEVRNAWGGQERAPPRSSPRAGAAVPPAWARGPADGVGGRPATPASRRCG